MELKWQVHNCCLDNSKCFLHYFTLQDLPNITDIKITTTFTYSVGRDQPQTEIINNNKVLL